MIDAEGLHVAAGTVQHMESEADVSSVDFNEIVKFIDETEFPNIEESNKQGAIAYGILLGSQAMADKLISDHDGIPTFWVCERCGQPLGKDGRCNSAIHVGPDDGNAFNGMAIATTDLVAELRQARAALSELVELKDGPRDEDYERRKPVAWEAARSLVNR